MAHIDDLVKQVSDPQLRAALMQQVSTLTSRKQFGLVFQEHSPESVRLPHQRVRTGDKVELRESKESATFHVISTKASLDVATVVQLDDAGETVGEPQDMVKTDLVVIKPFGDPVYPGLRQVGEAGSAKSGQPTHVVINGENYHALQALEYTHAGKVDLIYIDPPYNTGNSDWKYNDKYIDGSDSYRHSRWLSFMEKRLRIAKRMLVKTGILFVSIDDREHARLKMLCDQIFGSRNFVANFVWRTDGKTDNQATVKPNHEYILMYAADVTQMKIERVIDPNTSASSKLHTSEVRNSIVKNGPKNPVSAIDLPVGFPANFDSGLIAPGPTYWPRYSNAAQVENGRLKEPVTISSGWANANLLRKFIAGGFEDVIDTKGQMTRFELTPTGAVENVKLRRQDVQHILTVLFNLGSTEKSGNILKSMGLNFPYPKPVDLISYLASFAPKDAVIVDFFAGSGTTAEAAIRMNAADGGSRQCLIVTNNELSLTEDEKLKAKGHRPGDAEYEAMGVFHSVTMPRISTVLTGLREDGSKYGDGIDGQSAAFFDLTYEDENLISLGNKFEAIAPLLWMQSGATGELIAKRSDIAKGDDGYSVPEDGSYAVIFDTEAAADAIEALHDDIKKVFIVTDSENDFKAVTASLPGVLRNNAQRLYSSYLRSFEINRG